MSPKENVIYSSISTSKMCIAKFRDNKCEMLNRSGIGRAVSSALSEAKTENRLICGLMPAISSLAKNPDDALLCLLPETRPGDSATHMQTVLLQAFCYENCIPVIKVDCREKLAELCGLAAYSKTRSIECHCVVITRNLTIPWDNNSYDLTKDEQLLADFYECTIEENPSPIVQLPR